MKSNSLVGGMNTSMAMSSVEGRRLSKKVKALAEGVKPAESCEYSNELWQRWKAGDEDALRIYIKSNAGLFAKISFQLKAKFRRMDLEEIFSIVLAYSKTAFENYDNKRKASVISFHSYYAQYEVGHINEARSPLYAKQMAMLKKAESISFKEGVDIESALVSVIQSQPKKFCRDSTVQYHARKIIAASLPSLSLQSYPYQGNERIMLYETIPAPKEDLDRPLDMPTNSHQLERIKKYLAQDLSDRDKLIFEGMLKGMSAFQVAKENKVTTETIRHARKRIMKKAGHRANILKAQGIELSDLF